MKSVCGIIYVRNTERMMAVKNKNCGFTLVELFAVILIASTILIPLLSGYINNFTANNRMHERKAASSIAISSIEAFDKINYSHLFDILYSDDTDTYEAVRFDDAPIAKLQYGDCALLPWDVDEDDDIEDDEDFLQTISSEEICEYIFNLTVANRSFDENEFEVYLYPFRMTEEEKNNISDDIPETVQSEIELVPQRQEDDTMMAAMRITTRIIYDSERGNEYILNGVITSGYDSEEFFIPEESDD